MAVAHGETAEEHAAAHHHQHDHHDDEHHDRTAHHALALPSPAPCEREGWPVERVRCGRRRRLEIEGVIYPRTLAPLVRALTAAAIVVGYAGAVRKLRRQRRLG
jgi:hypothetical protein